MNRLFYYSFFDAPRTPSFKNRTFSKNQPHFLLYFPQFSRRHVFVLRHFIQVLPSKTQAIPYIFHAQISQLLHNFSKHDF